MQPNVINISEDDFMGSGKVKVVYRHPEDRSLCIKFPQKKKKRALHDILREISYLKKHQDNLPWLSSYLGEVNCDKGTGYLYGIIQNADGADSQSIAKFDHQKHKAEIEKQVKKMYFDLIDQHAVVNDLSLQNIYVRINNESESDFELVLIDGFGNNNLIRIADYSKFFLKGKLKRKFTKLCNRLNISCDFLL